MNNTPAIDKKLEELDGRLSRAIDERDRLSIDVLRGAILDLLTARENIQRMVK